MNMYVLTIGDNKFVFDTLQEAVAVLEVLEKCTQIDSEWSSLGSVLYYMPLSISLETLPRNTQIYTDKAAAQDYLKAKTEAQS